MTRKNEKNIRGKTTKELEIQSSNALLQKLDEIHSELDEIIRQQKEATYYERYTFWEVVFELSIIFVGVLIAIEISNFVRNDGIRFFFIIIGCLILVISSWKRIQLDKAYEQILSDDLDE